MNRHYGRYGAPMPDMMMNGPGWDTVNEGETGEARGAYDSMAASAVPSSPRQLHKRSRLSKLLDRLQEQINNNNNNNHYPPQRWLMFDKPHDGGHEDEAPLDLSIKSSPPAAAAVPSPPDFVCDACGQRFTVHDRLTKHVASRHRNRVPQAARAYECAVCNRRFARSDMLTRHARLHSGIKPYGCAECGQVFSRSDHLATHQRTHTGEKPYQCPSCPYAACRRDMITRHMRTHLRTRQPA